jgi:hypothetical protein
MLWNQIWNVPEAKRKKCCAHHMKASVSVPENWEQHTIQKNNFPSERPWATIR